MNSASETMRGLGILRCMANSIFGLEPQSGSAGVVVASEGARILRAKDAALRSQQARGEGLQAAESLDERVRGERTDDEGDNG
jgi:hypothetical protein